MVKAKMTHDSCNIAFSKRDEASVHKALKKAEAATSAGIHLIILRSSATYQEFFLLYAFALGSLIASSLWLTQVLRSYPALLAVQIGTMIVFDLLPFLRPLLTPLIPKGHRRRQAAERAMREFLHLEVLHHGKPFVLLFVSKAERYVHILTSPEVKARLPDQHWQSVTGAFAPSRKSRGLSGASIAALEAMASLLGKAFQKT